MEVTPVGPVTTSERPATDAPGATGGSGRWNTRARSLLDRRFDVATVSVGELAVLAAALVVAVVAVAGLAMAHLHRFSLTSAGLVAVGLLAVLGILLWVSPRPRRPVLDLPGMLVLLGATALAAFMFLPGFHYGAGDRDPGGYMMTGAVIAREGSVTFTDPILAADLPVQLQGPGARFPGLWLDRNTDSAITPQFYHLWPALLATADKMHGFAGMANTTPLVGILAVLLAVALARRMVGLVAAGVVGLLLSTVMLEVWQAKYPSAEMLTQMLFLAALLALVVSVQTGWRWPALVSGMLLVEGWLCRADGVLLVLLAVGCAAALWVLRRFDARGWWFATGLAVMLPYAAYQAYGPAKAYTVDNKVPGAAVVFGLVGACVVAAAVLRPLAGRLVTRVAGTEESAAVLQRRLGIGVVALYAALFLVALARPAFGDDLMNYQGRMIRSYDERSIYWLSWFFTWPGLLLVLAGVAFVALRRWQGALWAVAVPTLVFLPIYAWHARNSPFLMWWGRRYVSTVLPGMVLLMGVALGGLWRLRGRLRLAAPATAVALTAFLAAVYTHQSLPVRQHDEWGGSYFVTRDLAALGEGRQGVFLWQRAPYCCAAAQSLFAGPLWLEQDQLSVLLPSNEQTLAGYVGAYVHHFTDRPVFLVYEKGQPPVLPGLRVTVAREFAGSLPRWNESSITRPSSGIQIPYHFVVYRVESAS